MVFNKDYGNDSETYFLNERQTVITGNRSGHTSAQKAAAYIIASYPEIVKPIMLFRRP